MALFNLGKKTKEVKVEKKSTSACTCSNSPTNEVTIEGKTAPACTCSNSSPNEITDTELEGTVVASASNNLRDNKISVKVLGPGCASCHTLFENTKEALKNKGIAVDVDYVTDMQKIMEYGVMSVPALVINEKVVSVGKALKTAEVEKLLTKIGL